MENSKLSDVKGKELVAAGHAFAKAIGMDTPLIEIAKMVAELASRLDCALVRGDELEKQRDALAAENVLMLKLLTDISENHVEYFSEGEGYMFAGVPLDYVSEINMYVSRDVGAENPFPTTDAFLDSVRADELGKVAALINLSADKKQSEGYADCARDRRDLAVHFLTMAHQLRAVKDGE